MMHNLVPTTDPYVERQTGFMLVLQSNQLTEIKLPLYTCMYELPRINKDAITTFCRC